ncbi:MAG: NorM family multidrug efflux MATE transporter, partial [Pseudomonas sp.]
MACIGFLVASIGQDPGTVAGAEQFLSTLLFALPGYMTFMALRGFTGAIGRAGPVMAISIGGALSNIALNYVLIHGLFGLPRLGLAGIGLVTAIVSNLMALTLLLYVSRHPFYRHYRLLKGLRPSRAALAELLRLGLPIGGTYAVEAGLFAFAALCMGALGSTELAAHQIALQSVTVAFMVPVGISYAVTFRIGQHFGAGRLLEARRAGRLGIGLGAITMLGFSLLFWLAPNWVIGLFLDHQNPAFADVVHLAVSLLAIAALFELFDGTQTIAMGAIRGMKDANTTFWVGLGCYWLVGAPAAWWLAFPMGWGAQGVWWGLAAGLLCAAVGLTLGFEWKTARLLALKPSTSSTASPADCQTPENAPTRPAAEVC